MKCICVPLGQTFSLSATRMIMRIACLARFGLGGFSERHEGMYKGRAASSTAKECLRQKERESNTHTYAHDVMRERGRMKDNGVKGDAKY